MELTGRSAIVTGGAGGLGAATVRHLAGIGMTVVVFDLDGERAGELAKELGDVAGAAAGDTNDDDAVAAAIDLARSLGVLSLLVNVAGGGVGGGRTVARNGTPHDMGAFTKTMEMNAFGTFNMSRHTAAAMAANEPDENGERGVIVNTASIAGHRRADGADRVRRGQGGDPRHDAAHGPRPRADRCSRLRHRAGHDGHADHDERQRGHESAARAGHPVPEADGSAPRVRPPRGIDRDEPVPQRREHPPRRRVAVPSEVDHRCRASQAGTKPTCRRTPPVPTSSPGFEGGPAPSRWSSNPQLRAFFECWLDTFLFKGHVDPRLRELTILRVMWRCNQSFEWANHYRMARNVGVSREDIVAIRTSTPDRDLDGDVGVVVRAGR